MCTATCTGRSTTMQIQRVNKTCLVFAASLLIVAHYFKTGKTDTFEAPDKADRPLSHEVFEGMEDIDRRLQTVQIRFMLVNADTDKEITSVDLNTNGTFSLANLPTTAINIAANVTSTTSIGSVVFDIDGRLGYRSDTTVPFALCSESKGNFQSCGSVLGVGSHVVKATVRKSNGSVLASKTISFQGK